MLNLGKKKLYQKLLAQIDKQNQLLGGSFRFPHKGCPIGYASLLNIRNYVAGKKIEASKLLSEKKLTEVCKFYDIEIVATTYTVLC